MDGDEAMMAKTRTGLTYFPKGSAEAKARMAELRALAAAKRKKNPSGWKSTRMVAAVKDGKAIEAYHADGMAPKARAAWVRRRRADGMLAGETVLRNPNRPPTGRIMWMIVGGRRDSFAPGFEGTFEEAVERTKRHADHWKTTSSLYEVEPTKYRHEGGLKHLWAKVSQAGKVTPMDQPGLDYRKNPLDHREASKMIAMATDSTAVATDAMGRRDYHAALLHSGMAFAAGQAAGDFSEVKRDRAIGNVMNEAAYKVAVEALKRGKAGQNPGTNPSHEYVARDAESARALQAAVIMELRGGYATSYKQGSSSFVSGIPSSRIISLARSMGIPVKVKAAQSGALKGYRAGEDFAGNPGGQLRFRDLSVGETFVFSSERDDRFRFSGMARGPWIKNGPVTYEHLDDVGKPIHERRYGGGRIRVGSVDVEVIRKNPRGKRGSLALGGGIKVQYLAANQAWAVMWNDQVLRVFNSKQDAEYEAKRIAGRSKGEATPNPQKLVTKDLLAKIPRLRGQERLGGEAIAYIKFFTPWSNWTWYATEFDGQDTFFGLVQGFEAELGYFSLQELQGIKGPGGLRIERDIHFSPTPLSRLRRGNPLTKSESAQILRSAKVDLMAARSVRELGGTRHEAWLRAGRAQGAARTVMTHGPHRAYRVAEKIDDRSWGAMGYRAGEDFAGNPLTMPNPPAYFVIDPKDGKIWKIARAGKSMDQAFRQAVGWAKDLARHHGREFVVVVHPYVPQGFKAGEFVTVAFWHYGAQAVYPDGSMGPYSNPREGSMAKKNVCCPNPRCNGQHAKQQGWYIVESVKTAPKRVRGYREACALARKIQAEYQAAYGVTVTPVGGDSPTYTAENPGQHGRGKRNPYLVGRADMGPSEVLRHYPKMPSMKSAKRMNNFAAKEMQRRHPDALSLNWSLRHGPTWESPEVRRDTAGIPYPARNPLLQTIGMAAMGNPGRRKGQKVFSCVSCDRPYEVHKCGHQFCRGYWAACPRCHGGGAILPLRQRSCKPNPLTRGEAAQILRTAKSHVQRARGAGKVAGPMLLGSAQAGASIVKRFGPRGASRPAERVAGRVQRAIGNPPSCPWRPGQKIPIDKARAWVVSTGDRDLLQQFDEAYRLQCKANRKPNHVVWQLIPIGSKKRIDSVTAMVHYGDAPETLYHPPRGSKKGKSPYVHAWGETGGKKSVPILVPPGGKVMVTPLSGKKVINDWMRH